MPDPDASISADSLGSDGRFNTRAMADTWSANEAMYGPNYVDPANFRRPELYVYIYSVVDARPEGAHLFRSFPPLIPNLEILELRKGERYRLITKIPHPMNQACLKENGERYIDSHDARRVAMDIVNPDNLSLNQDFKPNPAGVHSVGNDYGRLGVFWSLLPTPEEEEIEKAIKRKEAFYRARLQQARKLEMTAPKQLYEYLGVNDHLAADYFGVETSWHQNYKRSSREEQLEAD